MADEESACLPIEARSCDGAQWWSTLAEDPWDCSGEGSNRSRVHCRGARVAVCIAGVIRSLTHPAVHESIREHLLDAIGAEHLFLYLKEGEGDLCCHGSRRPIRTDRRSMDGVLARLAMASNASTRHARTTRGMTVRYHNHTTSNADRLCAWKPQPNSNESDYQSRVLVNMLQQDHMCLSMIEEHELAQRIKFTHIARIRPDGAWLHPAPPPCSWPAAGAKYRDWAFFLPRAVAAVAMREPWVRYMAACSGLFTPAFPEFGKMGAEGARDLVLGQVLLQPLERSKDELLFPTRLFILEDSDHAVEEKAARVQFGRCQPTGRRDYISQHVLVPRVPHFNQHSHLNHTSRIHLRTGTSTDAEAAGFKSSVEAHSAFKSVEAHTAQPVLQAATVAHLPARLPTKAVVVPLHPPKFAFALDLLESWTTCGQQFHVTAGG